MSDAEQVAARAAFLTFINAQLSQVYPHLPFLFQVDEDRYLTSAEWRALSQFFDLHGVAPHRDVNYAYNSLPMLEEDDLPLPEEELPARASARLGASASARQKNNESGIRQRARCCKGDCIDM